MHTHTKCCSSQPPRKLKFLSPVVSILQLFFCLCVWMCVCVRACVRVCACVCVCVCTCVHVSDLTHSHSSSDAGSSVSVLHEQMLCYAYTTVWFLPRSQTTSRCLVSTIIILVTTCSLFSVGVLLVVPYPSRGFLSTDCVRQEVIITTWSQSMPSISDSPL